MTSVVVYKKLPGCLLASLQSEFDVTCFDQVDDSNRARFAEAIKGAEGLLGASVRLSADILEQAPRLRIISSISVGLDQFDVPYLDRRGIMLAHTPDVLSETTADAIFALLLASARRIVELAGFVKAGRWTESIGAAHYGVNVHGKTIGLVAWGGSAAPSRAAPTWDSACGSSTTAAPRHPMPKRRSARRQSRSTRCWRTPILSAWCCH